MHQASFRAAPVSTGSLHDTDDIMIVLKARALRRRWRLVGRVVKVLLGFGVVASVGLFATAPFTPFQCRSKQSEAKGNLKALSVAQMSYAAERGDGGYGDQEAIGFVPKGACLRYHYAITDLQPATADGPPRFVAWALANGHDEALAGDAWCIDETGDIRHLADSCARNP